MTRDMKILCIAVVLLIISYSLLMVPNAYSIVAGTCLSFISAVLSVYALFVLVMIEHAKLKARVIPIQQERRTACARECLLVALTGSSCEPTECKHSRGEI